VATDLLARIGSLAAEARDAADATALIRRQRDELIVEAVDEGVSQLTIARAAGLSKGRIIAILGNAGTTHTG
jgi:hypothetical protein